MNVLTLKQLLQNDMDQDKQLTFPVVGRTMSIDLSQIKSRFIREFFAVFKEPPMCLTFDESHIDMFMDENDEQDAGFMQQGYVSPWANLQPLFNEAADWDQLIPEEKQSMALQTFIEGCLQKVREDNGL